MMDRVVMATSGSLEPAKETHEGRPNDVFPAQIASFIVRWPLHSGYRLALDALLVWMVLPYQ
jgi:hypothetical protein